MTATVLATAAVALAVALQLASGSGFGLVAAPLLLLVLPGAVPVPLLLVTVPVMAAATWQNRAGLAAAGFELWPVAALAVPAAIGLAIVAWGTPAPAALIAIGLIELVAAVAGLAGWRVRQSRGSLLTAGLLSGALSTLVATPGPPVVVTYRSPDAAAYRANLSVYYLLITLVSLAPLIGWHGLSVDTALLTVGLLPGVLVGWPLGLWAARRLPAHRLRPAGLVLAGAAGVGLVLKALGQLTG